MQKSNEWAFTMELKKHLDEVTEDRVVMLSKILINKLKRLINDMNKSKLYDKKILDSYICNLEGMDESFRRIINDEIVDCLRYFNSCIALLKTISKCYIQDKKGNILKLLLIK
jgi:hypothetical protein